MTAAVQESAKPPKLWEVTLHEALERRWGDCLKESPEEDESEIRCRDVAGEAYEEVIRLVLYLHEARRRGGLSPVFLAELERSARIIARRLQRQLLARDHGGVCPPGHPALPPDPLAGLRGGG